MSATLHINKSDSNCAECGKSCLTKAIKCERCGETFTHVGSGYFGMDKALIASIRPDLEPNFYEGFDDDDLARLRHYLDGPLPGEEK